MSGPICVLIIDDSEDDREAFRRMLQRDAANSFRVLEAETGDEGIRLFKEFAPDCILLDYSLPGRNGVAVLGEIRKLNPFAAAVMLTGQGNEMVAVDVMKAGAQDYFIKSAISSDNLGRAVTRAITQQELAGKLEQQRQSLEIFTRAMAHDLKEPLRTIKSFGRIISDAPDLKGETRSLMDYVLKAADNMESLITSISRYTRLESQGRIDMREVSLADLLKQVKTNLHQQIESRGATIIEQDLGMVPGDALLLSQLLQNLVSNAIHYTNERPPVVTISTQKADGTLELRVGDNGPGIAAEYRDIIFEPFKRLVGREVEGSGLGLAICHRIAELHGATIRCEGVDSGGTVFITAFPIAAGHSATDIHSASMPFGLAAEPQKRMATGRTAEVLLVEDSPADVHLTRMKLMEMEKVHFNLHVSPNGKEALIWLEAQLAGGAAVPVDLVLLDINMPIMDGFQMLDKLSSHSEFRTIPVCMLSTSSDEADVKRARAHGASAYMVKPASREQLMAAIVGIDGLRLVDDNGGARLIA